MLCGSRGGLAVLLEASLKLQPAPETRVALVFDLAPDAIADAPRWAAFPRLEPAALTVLGGEAAAALPATRGFTVIVGLEDEARWVERQASMTIEALGPPALRIEGDDAPLHWQSLADLEDGSGPRLWFSTAHNTPAALAPLLGRAEARGLVFHAPSGGLQLPVEPGRAPELVRALATHGFTLGDARGAGALEPAIPPQAGVLALRARIRAELDPAGTLALGGRWAAG